MHLSSLRRLPVMRLLAIGEIAVLARKHMTKLDGKERHRLWELVKIGRAKHGRLSASERHELSELLAKVEPRAFAVAAADKFSPVPIPERFGRRRR
jgi:hypothetical protein